jgi:V/A-type H+-transporting ATPase subunit D
MAKLALNKSALSREKQRKSSCERYLPALELKQKQLLAECKKA